MGIPTPTEQVEFLQKIQRLLAEGQFVATYKFALLRSLADLAVLKGSDTDAELELTATDIAEVFIEVYWRQTRPFCMPNSSRGQVLRQNTGLQAAIIRQIAVAQDHANGSLPILKAEEADWAGLRTATARVIRQMPLWKLQRVGAEVVDFLYPNTGRGTVIRLRPGVAYCLRKFYGILRNLIEGAWMSYIRSQNLDILGQSTDLGTFLFGAERASLQAFRPVLSKIQGGACFYCQRDLRQAGDVDHFIPWARYPVDLGHNFVLAHAACNAAKRDHLAAEQHLVAWMERNASCGQALTDYCRERQLSGNLSASLSITRWAYSQTATANGLVWVERDTLQHLGATWHELLRVA